MVEFVEQSTVNLEQFAGGDNMVARAAWVSNETERPHGIDPREEEPGKIEGLINFLYRERHMSPFEHGIFTFYIETPIFVAREFHRHRTWSYNEMSGRYTKLPARAYMPPAERPLIQEGRIGRYHFVPGSDEQISSVRDNITLANIAAYQAYENLLDQGIAKEVARMPLPVNQMTRFYATANPRNVMQFLDLRAASQALYEIQAVAYQIEQWFESAMPITHAAWKKGRD